MVFNMTVPTWPMVMIMDGCGALCIIDA